MSGDEPGGHLDNPKFSEQSGDRLIVVRGLTKCYGDNTVVDNLDLDVFAGEILAILGPNGAGKTTTIEILEGFRERTGGEVSVLGIDPKYADANWRDRVGLVLQTSRVADDVTVTEAINHYSHFYRAPRPLDELVSLVGLEEKRDSKVSSLSGGQQRRLDVALGIVGRPTLLFLDEPTTGFDPEARRHFWKMIKQLRDEGTTIVLTTHYLEEAEFLADRVGVLVGGRLIEIGPPETLGGRAENGATVRWITEDGPQSMTTMTPTAAVAELAATFGGEVPSLSVSRPTLEDVYLSMIGAQK